MIASRVVLAGLASALAPALASDNSKSSLAVEALLAFDGAGNISVGSGVDGTGASAEAARRLAPAAPSDAAREAVMARSAVVASVANPRRG